MEPLAAAGYLVKSAEEARSSTVSTNLVSHQKTVADSFDIFTVNVKREASEDETQQQQ